MNSRKKKQIYGIRTLPTFYTQKKKNKYYETRMMTLLLLKN